MSLVKSIGTFQLRDWKDTKMGLERQTQMREESPAFLESLPDLLSQEAINL